MCCFQAANKKIEELTQLNREREPDVVVKEVLRPIAVPKIIEKEVPKYVEVQYEQICEHLQEEFVCSGVMTIPKIIIKEVPKIVEVKQIVEKEKLVYVKTEEVQAEEALYTAKLERQRQRLNAAL